LRIKYRHAHERGKGASLRFYGPDWIAQFYRDKFDIKPDDMRRSERRERREEIELRSAELDLGEREGRLVDADAFFRERLGPGLDEIRTSAERAANRYPEVKEMIQSGIDAGIERLQANGSTHYLTGNRSPGGKSSGQAKVGSAAKSPRVCKEVRKNAPRGTKGRGKIS
jgi:hypothetical protein